MSEVNSLAIERRDIMDRIDKKRVEERVRTAQKRTVIIEALRAGHVVTAAADYEGSGDEGCLEVPTFTDSVPVEATGLYDAPVSLEVRGTVWDQGKNGWVHTTEIKPVALREAVQNLFYSLLEDMHPGWEINEGSWGTMTWDIATDKVRIAHNERIVSREYSEV